MRMCSPSRNSSDTGSYSFLLGGTIEAQRRVQGAFDAYIRSMGHAF